MWPISLPWLASLKRFLFKISFVFGCLGLGGIGCVRGQIQHQEQAMRPAKKPPAQIVDDLGLTNLSEALRVNVDFLSQDSQRLGEFMVFGPRRIERRLYAKSLRHLLAELKSDPSGQSFIRAVKENFQFYEVYGDERWGQVFVTAYFEPILKASPKAPSRSSSPSGSGSPFSQPLYRAPDDLVTVPLGQFAERFPHWSLFADFFSKVSPRDNLLRGRLVNAHVGMGPGSSVIPYFDRQEIDSGLALRGRGLEIAWVDPIDAFFLHIQGSGSLEFPDGRTLRVGYASQNGHPYVPIGRYLLDVIDREQMSLQRIEAHLRSLPREEQQQLMFKNPSYIFFQELKGQPLTFMGTEVVEGRTIATDYQHFPKGALAYLEFPEPLFSSPKDITPSEWKPSSRFVLDQDTGGAIRGPHRVDLFWGRGEGAKQAAGVMRHPGRLHYLVPSESLLAQLRDQSQSNSISP